MGLLRKWVQIYRNEMRLFLWVSAVYFLIRSSTIIFGNFTETTFLKRYGVAYLPLVYMINAAVTFPKGLSLGEIAGIALHTSGINYSRGKVVIQAKEPVEGIYFI